MFLMASISIDAEMQFAGEDAINLALATPALDSITTHVSLNLQRAKAMKHASWYRIILLVAWRLIVG